jgi:hypothetical protein
VSLKSLFSSFRSEEDDKSNGTDTNSIDMDATGNAELEKEIKRQTAKGIKKIADEAAKEAKRAAEETVHPIMS